MIWAWWWNRSIPISNEFKLLLCCSAGTKYAWFLHDIVVMEQQETLAYMEEAKKQASR